MTTQVQALFLPYEITMETGRVTGFRQNSYSVDITTTLASIETRTLLPGGRNSGSISVTIDAIDDIAFETLMDFYELCKSSFLAFEIRKDHPIWVEFMPAFTRKHFYDLWRFEGELQASCVDTYACIWNVGFNLKNVPI